MITNKIGLKSGIGLVIANMIGSGVLISAGFMSQNMSASAILSAWIIGLILASCGAKSYATIATTITRSGGEYRYLSDLFHPFLGNMAGWGSLILGFSAPIAINALAVGWFLPTLGIDISPLITGTVLILALSLIHGVQFQLSKLIQNFLIFLKILVVLALILIGLTKGNNQWPSWNSTHTASTDLWINIFKNQYWIVYAFSGWNAAIYVANEFQNPKKQVPAAMIIGCITVGIVYLIINLIFITNLSPASSKIVFQYGDGSYVTLAHVLVEQLIGNKAAMWASISMIIILISSMSAMSLVGPRVYAEMAEDNFLPSILKKKNNNPPLISSLLQMCIALLLLHTHSLLEIIKGSSVLLMIFTACTTAGVWVIKKRGFKVSKINLLASAIYFISTILVLWYGLTLADDIKILIMFVVIIILTGFSYRKRNSTTS